MCPISGLVQFLIVIVTLLLICHATVVRAFQIKFEPSNVTVHMDESFLVNYTVIDNYDPGALQLNCYSNDPDIASIDEIEIKSETGSFPIFGNFLGETRIVCKIKNTTEELLDSLDVIVIRKKRVIDTVFTVSVATLVSIIYINFGCALNWKELWRNLKRPIGPVIGFLSQFLLMPVLSYVLGKVLFPDNAAMQLGMFFTGVSPAGGASNIWTVFLDGNMDLSITMTTISTLAAFGMMPLWIFTLGKEIFDKGNLEVPYSRISMYAIGLVVPLAIGYLLSRYCTRVAQFLARILKVFSSLLILFIVIFAIVTNLYLFKLFSWQIVVAGMGLPYLGYIIAYAIAKVLRQSDPDCLAIAIEAGIQNTGIAIFLLRFALTQPQADLTTVVPVAVAIMTPFPLLFLYLYKKIKSRISGSKHKKLDSNLKDCSSHIGVDNNFNKDENPDKLIATVS